MNSTTLIATTPTTIESSTRLFLSGNLGAVAFLISYIGFYGFGLILYFAYQFISENSYQLEDEIPAEFFQTFHHINERQDIYRKKSKINDEREKERNVLGQLTDEEWLKRIYQIYYNDEVAEGKRIEDKANACARKYHEKLCNLRSRHVYYVEEHSSPLILHSISTSD